jgi:hypothetical protein
MGGKHRLINKFMTPEVLAEYSKLPTTEAEFQDVQALLNLADQPERNLMKKVKEKERSKKLTAKQINLMKSQMPSTSYGQGSDSYHGLPPHLNFNPESMHFLAMGGPSFNDHLAAAAANDPGKNKQNVTQIDLAKSDSKLVLMNENLNGNESSNSIIVIKSKLFN